MLDAPRDIARSEEATHGSTGAVSTHAPGTNALRAVATRWFTWLRWTSRVSAQGSIRLPTAWWPNGAAFDGFVSRTAF